VSSLTTVNTPLGVFLPTEDDDKLIRRIEALGYHSVWAGEGQGRSAFGKLERWAMVTEELQLATGIVNIYSRSPATIAQATATLDDHSDGRAILGLGVAHPGLIEDFHGINFSRPITRMEEYVTLIRQYLGNEPSLPSSHELSIKPSRTRFWDAFDPVRRDVPLFNGALGRSNIRLTGRLFDGWVGNMIPIERLEEVRRWLAEGAAMGGRDEQDITVAMYILVSVDEDPIVAARRIADHVVYYLRQIPGYYDRSLTNAGFGDAVKAIIDAPDPGTAVMQVTDELIDAISLVGTSDEAREQLTSYVDAGVDLPIIRAPTGVEPHVLDAVLTAFC